MYTHDDSVIVLDLVIVLDSVIVLDFNFAITRTGLDILCTHMMIQ